MPITKFKNEKEKEEYLEELKKERNTSNNSNKRIYNPTNVDLEKKSSSSKNLKQSIKETKKNNSLPKASETNSLPTASNKEYLSRNANIPTLSLDNVTKSKIGIENNVNSDENKNNILNNSQAKNNYYLSDLPTANSLSKYKLKKEENTEETVKNIDELSPAELEAYNIPITSNKDPRLSLMKKRAWEYDAEDYKNLAEINQVSQQKYADSINEFAEKHPVLAGLYNTEMNIANGMYSVVNGTNNLANTAELWMAKGAEKLGQLTQNEELVNKAQATYDKTLAESNYLASTGNFISGGNQGIDNNIIRTVGNVGNVVGNQLMSAGIGGAAGIPGSTMQAVGLAGSSMQEVLAENPDNLLQATLTGTLKGIASKKIEDLFDANILTINSNKSSVQNQVTKWISNTFKSNAGKNIANMISGTIGENAEEFIEDNVDNIIDKLVNNKDLPSFNEWWDNTTETAKITTISTITMSLLRMGGDSLLNKETTTNSETDFWINEAQKIIDNEKMAISKNVGDTLLNQLANNVQNSGNIQSELNQQQITPQEIKTAQNGNMGQIDNERSSLNNYRLQLPSETKTTSNQSITSQNENVNYINNYAQQSENNTNNIKNTYNELSDMLNNKDLPMQYYQYEKSDNVKVNTLKESASKYFNNSEQTKNYISMLEQIVTDKNIEIRFEDNLKTPDGKTANGSYSDGIITINPNSSSALEFITVHELTHAIGTNEMVKMIENFKNSNVELSTEMKALLDNYSSTEINEEALADVSAQLLGNQEFINNVAQNNSNIFKKIYSEIKYLWHQFRGYKNQNQFVEDLYYKWTKAYNSSNELNSTTNYSTETLEDGTTYVKAENNKFIKEDGTKMTPREAYQSLIGTTIQFSDGDSAKIVNRLPNKDMYNELSKRYPSKFKNVENIKEVNGSINDNIEELLTNTTIKEANVPDFKDRHQKQGIKNFDTRTVKFYDGNNAYDIDFSIAVLEDGSKVAYAKKYIEGNQNLTQKIKTVEARSEKSSLDQQSLSKDSIAPSNNDVNTSTKYSIQESENNSGSFNLENKNSSWYDYLERTFPNKGTRTYAKDILVKKADNEGSYSTRNNKNNVANSLNTIYNNVESESVANEGRNLGNNNQLSRLYEENQYKQEKQYTRTEYEQWEQSIEPITYSKLTEEQKQLKNDIKRQYGKDIVFFDGQNNSNGYSAGASFNDSNRINIDIKQAEQFGITKMVYHEVLESNILYNREQYNEYIKPTIEKIINDENFQKQKQIFWSEQTGNIPSDILIAKDIICDRYAEIKSNETMDYQNVLSQETNMTIDYAVENFENNLKKKKTTNNAPSSDNNSFGTSTEENSWSKQQAEKKKQRKHYESIIKSNYTTDEAKAIAKELMGTDTYVPESNSRQLEVADERIASAGADSELNSLMSRATTGGNIKSDDIAVGERLIQYYSKTGDKFKLQEAIQATAMAGTTAGQTVQAMALLNHQTPEGQAIWLQRSVDKMNSDLRKTRGKNAEQFNLTAEMLEKVASSENIKALEENLNEVYKELGQQVTKTTAQKIDAWRYFSMLSSPKTHIRNITGNTAMAGVQGIKNKVAGTIEGVVGKFNSNMERTHTIALASKEVKSFAKADIENVADRLGLNENKYNPKTRLENNMRTFKSDVMEKTVGKVFEINNNLLEAEDGWGLKAGYVKALSEYMTANNLTPDTITDKQLSKARNYAVEQAKEATFHQDSQLASLVNQLSNKNKFSKFILDSTLPFKKTPINVAKAGIEYSPVGLVKSAVYDTVKLRKGDITVNKYIDNISKGLTGTGIALVGYALRACGILKASGSDDEDRESFEEGRGSQNYSITIGDNTYSLDWLAPSGIPLFIGAECYELMQASSEKKTSSSDDDKIYNQAIESATNILDSFANAMNPMTEMSMLSGLTSALKSYDQGSSQMLASLGTNAVKSYVNQFFPTGLGQIAKTIDGYERSTTSTKTGVLPKAIDTTKNQIMSKIPVLRELLPAKTGTWGEEMKQSDNVLVRALENSVLPWTRKELNSTDVDKEILSVYENTGESSVFPDSINKNITIDKQKYTMTAGEYAKYKQQYGQTSYNLLNSLIKSSGYKKLSDEQKQLAIEKIYSYSTEQIKVNYAKQNGLNYKQSTLSSVVNSIKRVDGNTSNYFEFLAKTQDLTKESERVEILANSNYSNSTKTAIYENSLGKDDSSYKILKRSFTDKGLNITKYLKYKSQEFTSDKEDDGTVNGKAISGSKKDKVIDYINSISGTTYTQRILLYGLKYKPELISDRELIVNYIRDNWTGSERTEMFEQFTWITQYKNGKIGI